MAKWPPCPHFPEPYRPLDGSRGDPDTDETYTFPVEIGFPGKAADDTLRELIERYKARNATGDT